MRAIALAGSSGASSGHLGGSLSIVDVATALDLNWLNHDPDHPSWPERDGVFWSAGQKAHVLPVVLERSGHFPLEVTVTLRQLGSKLENPNLIFHCVECRKIALPC
jgi:transketolase